ncbi:MAG: PKD domain-containing protein [Bacteroidales bacterium]|nr:PKD domain-containing protein [Bacteroidales bacterium]MCF8344706.1 PKD domain-containing protein [Bacteroidales bacterium]MCF8349781.1 PKD domain-containing protein [Bacteroidales bacterium]MCF8376300.1 PKD domain-containing protein [Bacteroidales bacterium]MCF8400994.1 PKD domain-containing protein [Bacteroidales bacterium]
MKRKVLISILILGFFVLLNISCNEEDKPDEFGVEARLTAIPETGTTATGFFFDASATETVGEWATIKYEWKFGDGSTNYQGSETETHQYDQPGEYIVSVNVKIYKKNNQGSAGDVAEVIVQVDAE